MPKTISAGTMDEITFNNPEAPTSARVRIQTVDSDGANYGYEYGDVTFGAEAGQIDPTGKTFAVLIAEIKAKVVADLGL